VIISNPNVKRLNLPFFSGMDNNFDVLIEVFYSSTKKNKDII